MLNLKDDSYELLYNKKIDKEYSVDLGKLNKGEKASILSDTMFKTMFQNSNRLKYSCKFLSYYLDISYEELLGNIKLVKNEIDKKYENDKGRYCDYVATIKGSTINIEVNNNSDVKVMERNMEYAHRLYASKVRRKSSGELEYTQVIQFNLNNFSFVGNDKIIDKYFIQNEEGIRLNNKLIFIQIYVPNLRKKCYNLGRDNLREEEKHLLAFIERDVELSKELGEGDEIMEEYIDEAVEVTGEEFFGEAYDKEWALKDEGIRDGQRQMIEALIKQGVPTDIISKCTDISYEEIVEMAGEEFFGEAYDKEWALKDEGIREGREEGRRDAQKEMVLSLLKENVDINTIAKCTDLSIEEINSLK